jgi:hypothetical protein
MNYTSIRFLMIYVICIFNLRYILGLGQPFAPIVIENISHVPSNQLSVDVRLTRPFQEPDPYIARNLKFIGDCLNIYTQPFSRDYPDQISAGGPYQIEVIYPGPNGSKKMVRLPYAQKGQGWQLVTHHVPQIQTANNDHFKYLQFRRGTARERCLIIPARSPYTYLQ